MTDVLKRSDIMKRAIMQIETVWRVLWYYTCIMPMIIPW